ncbi:hypothetical protein D5H75_09085 [Bailinhaonella thermotolerans]|uniref:Glycosyltransferase RgtA/B/C/D-like domain-containing protein n=1 Tax=Bailinhaonella thermotolerans TaxID=1070861 RepID=A0A3A4B3C2_9ACTN|nr:hypothetical protein D5H75_09085 [Bailinhaonella thermotolerans]
MAAPVAARRTLAGSLGGHGPFAAVLAVAAALRALTMLGFRPARIYYGDTFAYLRTALDLEPMWGFQPSGYAFFLRALRPFGSVEVVAGAQHALGLATGVLVYAILRRRGLPWWGASLATVPVLFDAQMLQLENALLSDTLFIFLVVAAVVALMWSPRPSGRAGLAAGPLLAAAALTRTIGLPLLLLFLAYLAARRSPRALVAAALAGLVPLAAYAGWYRAAHGTFRLAGGDGVALWARTMTFADCAVIRPPADLAALCPNGTVLDAASEYVWDPASPLNRLPGGPGANEDRARAFAVRAILAQPYDYAAAVARDVSLAFHWTPARHPERVTPAFGFHEGVIAQRPADAGAWRALRAYAPGTPEGYRAAEPYAGLLRAYQYPAYLRGPFLAAILLLGLLAVRRRGALLPWATAVALLVAPVAVLDFDHRYVLPVPPLACVAAALLFARRGARPRDQGQIRTL